MSTPVTFRTLSADELSQRTSAERELALTGLEIIEADPEHPGTDPLAELISVVLPYAKAAEAYRSHVNDCTDCQDSPVWDIACETGNRLATLAADACMAQADCAALN